MILKGVVRLAFYSKKLLSLYQFKSDFEADKIIVQKLDQSKNLADKALGVQISLSIIIILLL